MQMSVIHTSLFDISSTTYMKYKEFTCCQLASSMGSDLCQLLHIYTYNGTVKFPNKILRTTNPLFVHCTDGMIYTNGMRNEIQVKNVRRYNICRIYQFIALILLHLIYTVSMNILPSSFRDMADYHRTTQL
jgi:hypothetical protein